MDADEDLAGLCGETDVGGGVADIGDDTADDGLPVDFRLGGDFTGNDNEVGCAESFTSHAALGILSQAGVEDRIGDLIGNFVGMPFGNRFRSKNVFCANLAH